MSDTLLSARNLAFELYEVLDAEALSQRPRFADHNRETFDAALHTARTLAERYFAPHNRKGDEHEPRFENGEAVLIPEVKHADIVPGRAGIRAQAVAPAGAPHPLRHTSLRYFNVVGSGDESVYDSSPHNLFPIVFEKLLAGETPRINGDDYDTPDGTNVRDYVHVADIAAAHVVAAQRLAAGLPVEAAYNLGSQNGLSVREIMDAMARVTGIAFTPEIGPRRAGDPDRIVATGELAARDLGWVNRYTVDEMVRSGWDARRNAS